MQFFLLQFQALLEKREDALLQDISRMFIPRLQEHTIDWLQGGTHNLRMLKLEFCGGLEDWYL